jgi:hypothetical protein
MGTSSTRYQINALDSAGQARTLIITEYLVTHQGDAPDDITPMLDRATCETEDGQKLGYSVVSTCLAPALSWNDMARTKANNAQKAHRNRAALGFEATPRNKPS